MSDRLIKFDIISKHPDSDELYHQVMTLEEIEECVPDYVDYEVVARRQYTGLQDINGRDTFDDDIWLKDGCVYLCQWTNAYAEFSLVAIALNNRHTGEILKMFHAKQGEVVGNIYDNPDLLKAVADA